MKRPTIRVRKVERTKVMYENQMQKPTQPLEDSVSDCTAEGCINGCVCHAVGRLLG